MGDRRTDLHRLFQAVVDSGSDIQASLCDQAVEDLAPAHGAGVAGARRGDDRTERTEGNVNWVHRRLLDYTNMASFYTDAGWYDSAARIYLVIVGKVDEMLLAEENNLEGGDEGCHDGDDDDNSAGGLGPTRSALMAVKAEASVKLLANLSSFCKFTAAAVRRPTKCRLV